MVSVIATARAERRTRRLSRRRPLSPLTLRILAVNVLALAILVGGLLYLNQYQDRLIHTQLDALITEGRTFASALGEGAVVYDADQGASLNPNLAQPMVRRLFEATETRTRLYADSGTVLADSRMLEAPGGAVLSEVLPPPPRGNALERMALSLYDTIVNATPQRRRLPLYHEIGDANGRRSLDVSRALNGDESATIWRTSTNGLIMTVAVPVQRFKQVLGAVLLSRDGEDVDATLRSVRADILKVFGVTLAVTVLMSFYLAGTIARPIRRLAAAAERVRRGHGGHREIPDFSRRHDEIGDLSGALRDMTAALSARMDAIERFAADVAHEIKNPLSSLRSAVETVGKVNDPERQRKLMAVITDDVQRLDRLISDISNASRIDAEMNRVELEPIDVPALLDALAGVYAATAKEGGPRVVIDMMPGARLAVAGFEGRLVQVLQNLVTNALSFSPPDGSVRLCAEGTGAHVEITVSDDGPGIPESKLEAIFDRFYTERPAGEKFGTHSGLGLSISKQIVEAHGGEIFARNRYDADGRVIGAVFTVRLPRLRV